MSKHACVICGSNLNQYLWCNSCDRKQLMEGWTSGNARYDSIIKSTQKNVNSFECPCIRWIPTEHLRLGERLSSDYCNAIGYEADWLDGEYLEPFICTNGKVACPRKSMRVLVTCDQASTSNLLERGASMILEIQKGRKWLGTHLVGMTRLRTTGQYALVHASFCPTCNRSYPMNSSWWCNDCDRKQLMEGWTSGNSEYDKIIKDTQHEVTGFNDPCLRWIPPYLIKDWVKIAKGGYGTVHSAKWIGAKFKELEMHIITHMVTPVFEELKVAIKTFDSEQDFRNELKAAASPFQLYVSQIRPIGISRVEATGKYCLVMNYAENRDLLYYLQKNPNPSVDTKIKILVYLVNYLKALHVQNLIHRNIHSGNVLIGSQIACDGTRFLTCALTDYGLSINKDNVNCLGKVSGVLPYIAPEVIRGKPYTQAADIYAFGILMWLLECCDLPFNDRPHDNTLASAICQGLRPELPTWTSDCYSKLYKCCVDADFSKRPSAYEIFEIISKWEKDPKCMHALNIAYKSQKKNFLKRNKKIHPGAIYTSRTFNFENLMTKINPKSILSSRENLLPSVEEIRKWDTPDTLINFLKNPKLCLNLKEDHFKFFHSQEIDGPAFLLLTEEVLISDGLKRGPAVKIANLIKEILEGEGRSKNAQNLHKPGDQSEVIVENLANMEIYEHSATSNTSQQVNASNLVPEKTFALVEKANQYKTAGNALFNQENYSEAIEKYKKALDTCPTERVEERAVYWGNIGACKIKLGKYVEAVDACTKALEQSPKYTKALLRRAEANEKIGTITSLKHAHEDCKVLKTNAMHQSSLSTEAKRKVSTSLARLHAQILKAEKSEKVIKSAATDDATKSTSTSNITLYCVMAQRTPDDAYIFSVQVGKDKTIEDLKKIIKLKHAPDFDHFPVEDLELCHVDIPNSREDVLSFFNNVFTWKQLPANRRVRDFLSPNNRIRILVEPPRQVILLPPNGEPKVIIQPRRKFESIIGCDFISCQSVMLGIPGYELTLCIDDLGLIKDLPRNALATSLLYGKNADDVPGTRGTALLIDTYRKLTLDDFNYLITLARQMSGCFCNCDCDDF